MAIAIYVWLLQIEGEARTVESSTLPALSYSAQIQTTSMEAYSLFEEFALYDNLSDRTRIEGDVRQRKSRRGLAFRAAAHRWRDAGNRAEGCRLRPSGPLVLPDLSRDRHS